MNACVHGSMLQKWIIRFDKHIFTPHYRYVSMANGSRKQLFVTRHCCTTWCHGLYGSVILLP